MTNLNIEFLPKTNERDEYIILVNGENFCEESHCYEKRWLFIYDEKLFNSLCKYTIKELFNFFEGMHISIQVIDDTWITFNAEFKKLDHKGVSWAAMELRYDVEEWNRPWSIKQHFNALIEKVKLIPGADISCDIDGTDKVTGKPIYNLFDGMGLKLPIENPSMSLEAAYSNLSNLCSSLEKEIENDFLSSIHNKKVTRSITFPPEYHQAGLGILNYFGTYLREQYAEARASVTIEQHGLNVRMIIATEDGKLETIEKALHEYELIVTGAVPPEKFSLNDKLIFELKNELRIAQFRLESQRDLIGLQNGRIDKLLNILGDGLSQKHQVTIDFKPEITLSNNVIINQNIAAALSNVNELMEELPTSTEAYLVLDKLKEALAKIETVNDPETVRRSSAMSRFKRLIDTVIEKGSDLNEAIKKAESGWEIFRELAGKYNKVAEWCGLPTVPTALLNKS